MGNRLIVLVGFEKELLDYIAANFRFSSVELKSYPLEVARNLFDRDMPDTDSLRTAQAARIPQPAMKFDPKREPAIAFYLQPGSQIGKSVSSDSKHEWILTVSLRMPKSLGAAADHLAELCQWMHQVLPGKRTGRFILRSANITQAAAVVDRGDDDQAYAGATMEILGVPLPQ